MEISSQMQEYSFVRGYESTMQECLNFGLSDVSKIDKLTIEWPDGNLQTLTNIDVNQHLKIKYKKEKNITEETLPKKTIYPEYVKRKRY